MWGVKIDESAEDTVVLLSRFGGIRFTSVVCRSCFKHIRDLWRIHSYLDMNRAKLLANAMVPSRPDYCKSLSSGITDTGLTKLHRVQNRLASDVTKSPPFTHRIPCSCSLHLLSLKCRVDFGICLLSTWLYVKGKPVYLHSMLAPSLTFRSIWSNKGITLLVLRLKTNTGVGVFTLVPPSFVTVSRYLFAQPPQL